MPSERALLFSIKPVYAELLLAGTKTVELRRVRPQVEPGSDVLLYASSPAMEMVGTARVEAIDIDSVPAIWARHAPVAGIDRDAYEAYFAGADFAVAVVLFDINRLPRGVPLAELRRRIAGFRPPQSFKYVASAEASAVI